MEKKTLEILFTNKHFFIPDYQRDYAWQSKNVADLFDDVRESIETDTPHYIGTFIFSKVGLNVAESIVSGVLHGTAVDQTSPTEDAARKAAAANLYALVDGQQRLTTLSMILHTLVAALPSNDDDRVFYERRFLRSRSVPHLLLQKNNHDFYYRLLQNSDGAVPSTRGQRLLAKAHADIKRHVQALVAKNGDQTIRYLLEAIKDLEVLEFIEEDEGRAIRIFQTVNDRGVRPAATPARNRLLEATCTVSAPPPPATRWSAEMRCPQGPRHREAWRDPAPELVRPASRTPFRRHTCANGLAPFVPRYGRQRGARES
jgi:hypothetical protein